MFILGLTGAIASGKSTVSKMFQSYGVPVICADEITHQLQQQNTEQYHEIISHFGTDILDDTSNIDRNKLAKKVMEKSELAVLENILHPAIRAKFQQRLVDFKSQNVPLIVLDVPLLYTSELQEICDAKAVCMCADDVRKQRAFERSGMSEEKWQFIKSKQPTSAQYLAWADIVIDTEKSLEETEKTVKELIHTLP